MEECRVRRWGWQDRLQIAVSICQAVLWLVAFLANWPLWVLITLIAIVLVTIGIEHLWPMSHKKAEDIASRAVVASFVIIAVWGLCLGVGFLREDRTVTTHICEARKDRFGHSVVGIDDDYAIQKGLYFGKAYTDVGKAVDAINAHIASSGSRVIVRYHYGIEKPLRKVTEITQAGSTDNTPCG